MFHCCGTCLRVIVDEEGGVDTYKCDMKPDKNIWLYHKSCDSYEPDTDYINFMEFETEDFE